MITSPLKAIRAKCLDCVWGQANEVRKCHLEDCELHPFRFGKNPFSKKREYTEDERLKMCERTKMMRDAKKALQESRTP